MACSDTGTITFSSLVLNIKAETVYSYFMATRETVKLLSRGSGEDLGNQLPRDNGLTVPQVALK